MSGFNSYGAGGGGPSINKINVIRILEQLSDDKSLFFMNGGNKENEKENI